MRLGVYADLVYRVDTDGHVSTDRAFIQFVAGLGSRLDELVLFGRRDPVAGRAAYVLPEERVRLVSFPFYKRVSDVAAVLRSLRVARRAFASELDNLDAVWLFGPYPASLAFAAIARRRGVPLFLGVRQDFPEYIRHRLPSRRWAWAVGFAHASELIWRRLARSAPAVVVGDALAAHYPGALATGFSLIRDDDIVSRGAAHDKDWTPPLRAITVGRLDQEKNPLLLPEILRGAPDWRLEVVGTGPMRDQVLRRAEELGVADRLHLAGYVPNGPELWSHYRNAHAFLHVSLTEGLPQVLFEAQANGLPIVATDVGGVRAAVGEDALLVQPRDAVAPADALNRLRDDPDLRRRLIDAGLAAAAAETMDVQLDRLAAFFRDGVQRSAHARRERANSSS